MFHSLVDGLRPVLSKIAFYISITVLNQNDGTAVLGPGLIENSEILSEFHTTTLKFQLYGRKTHE